VPEARLGPTRDWIKFKCDAWKEANRWRAEVLEKSRWSVADPE